MFAEHILKVHYPYGGPHFLLMWHSHNEGNHLIIGRKQATVETTFHRVLQEHSDAVVKNFLHVDIVAPSLAVCEKYADQRRRMDIRIFWDLYTWPIDKYKKKHGSLPPKLKECDNYSSQYDEEETLEQDPEHSSCKNCCRGSAPIDGTLESVYLKHRESFLIKRGPLNDHAQIARAAMPDMDQALYAITTSFGHHREGLVGHEAKECSASDNYLFFYQHPEVLTSTKCDAMVAQAEQEHQVRQKLLDEHWKKRVERQESEEIAQVQAIFG